MEASHDQVKTGESAIEYVTDSWDDLGMGQVQLEAIDPWLIVRRSGGDYSLFLSMVDGTAVLIENDGATTRHVPKDLRPEETLPSDRCEVLERAFGSTGGGSFPLPEQGVFEINFTEGDETKALRVGLLDGTFEYDE